jgi:hypothetical protein
MSLRIEKTTDKDWVLQGLFLFARLKHALLWETSHILRRNLLWLMRVN